MMKTNTKYFGEMDYEKDEVITFPEGLFGFEDEKEYLLIRFENDDDTLLALQSIKTPTLAFITLNPFRVMPDYKPYVADEDLAFLDIDNQENVAIYAIAVVGNDIKDTTVNLKAPLVVNPESKKGRQVILENPEYTCRHHFSPAMSGEDD